ncbi:MAG: hypothetical protein VKK98_10265 [Cyanobacteriota bacterium]|nr:hypothetical protein [Cyanobacteriota bacterium]
MTNAFSNSGVPAMQSTFNNLFQTDSSSDENDRLSTSDAMEAYFSCITTCSLDDGECVTRCVEELREQH